MTAPQFSLEVSQELAGSGIMQESELQASITRTQNDMDRLHEDVVRIQDGVVLLGEQLSSLHTPLDKVSNFPCLLLLFCFILFLF